MAVHASSAVRTIAPRPTSECRAIGAKSAKNTFRAFCHQSLEGETKKSLPVELKGLKINEKEHIVAYQHPPIQAKRVSHQKVDSNGRVHVSKKAWIFRVCTIAAFAFFCGLIAWHAFQLNDYLVLFALVMPAHALIVLVTGWLYYRNPTGNKPLTHETMPLVSVIIPIYNQAKIIETVIEAIYKSTYKRLDVIAVNDGSTDGTGVILDRLAKRYNALTVIHKKNSGKRKSVAAGFYASRGSLVVLMDSDTIMDHRAIEQIVMTFNNKPNTGAAVANVKLSNENKNMLTKCQASWYDFAFNLQKSCESVYGSVLVCSGCLSGYRREAIEAFIPYWAESKHHYSDDRELTWYTNASKSGKKYLFKMLKKSLLQYASSYDDSDDRVITANVIDKRWDSTYIASAICYTEVPDTLKTYQLQQIRWKKGTIRTNLYVWMFFWRRNPLMAFVYYFEVIGMFITPLLTSSIIIYEIFVVGQIWFPVYFFGLLLWKGMTYGLDFKLRDSSSATWMYKPMMVMIQTFYLSFLIFPALANLKSGKWGTR